MKTFFLLPLLLAAASAFAQRPITVDDTARFLAGLPVEGGLAPFMETPAWQEHAREMDQAWARKERQQILPIREWMAVNAPEYVRSTETMFYMFGGPDFLYANVFFPSANTYILAGLEPVGQIPNLPVLSPPLLAAQLAALRNSMSSILRFQYFITKDMRAELGGANVSGTLPILYVFLARLGYTVVEVTPQKIPADGVRITFHDPARGGLQTLYYFRTDLSGSRTTPFMQWCAERGPGLSLLKAASFLMHGDGFNAVRNFLFEHSRVLVQDDSGIPLRAFPRGWEVRCFGRYVPHNETFAKYHQPDLEAVYRNNPPGPLGFAFGYHWQKEDGLLMLAAPEGNIGPAPLRPAPETLPIMKALPVGPDE